MAMGVEKDEVEAVKWYRKAAEQNDATAQSCLAACYVNGQGVAKDYVEGYKWMLLAAAQGLPNAKTDVTTLEGIMSQEQIADGQKLANTFKPGESNGRQPAGQTQGHRTATAVAKVEDGMVTEVTVTSKATYTWKEIGLASGQKVWVGEPKVYIQGGGGTGATARAYLGYSSEPEWPLDRFRLKTLAADTLVLRP